MKLQEQVFNELLGSDETTSGRFEPPLVNVGVGEDISIRDLAYLLRDIVGFDGRIVFDASKFDGTPRKLLDVSKLSGIGWRASTDLRTGLSRAYADFMASRKKSDG